MQCSSCQRENPDDAAFCNGCGSRLARICRSCERINPPDASFCNGCGAAFDAGAPAAAPPAARAPTPPVTSASDPRTLADGRYSVERLLGEGGKKRVYLAQDSSLGRDVALALIKTDSLDDPGQARVRHEAQAMGRLGDHPHIVTVFDIGEENGQLYIVSEYMAGGDVEGRLRAAENGRLATDEAIRIAREVCLGLEHAHGAGIIHRDLKPGNVWLKQDGSAAIGDFGLALSEDRTRITQEGMMVGTVAYMPPEQALGRAPDPKSDLYALGITLYEMLTGRTPFEGDDAVSIISQHINTPPVAPSWHNGAIAKPLDALVLRLLAKDPAKRPESATHVREALEAVSQASTVAAAPSAEVLNPLDRLASGIFVGRDTELGELRGGVDAALSGRGQILLLVGEPGIGKTRTSEELATYANLRGAAVLWGRCYEGEGAPIYWPWVQIVRSYTRDRDPAALLNEMGAGASAIADVVSEVRDRLPGLQPAAQLAPEEARFRLFDALTGFLKNASRQQPLVLVLDDLHWADKPSLLLLQFVARELAGQRILLLGTYRDVELGRKHPLAETLAELSSSELSRRVLLRGLGKKDVGRFLELSAGHQAPGSLVTAVYRETEGNPFFVNEVTRLLASEGRLDADQKDSGTWSVAIPQGVREAVGRRLNQLSDECNEVLAIGSVIGREFDLVLLERVAEQPEGRVMEALDEALAARVIQEMPEAPGRYRFAHALIRETLYGELNTTRRVRLHRSIGDRLESLHGENLDPRLAELAYHFGEGVHAGGDVAKAVRYSRKAGQRATGLMAHEDAIPHYERALQLLELAADADPALRCDLTLALGWAERFGGDPVRGAEALERGMAVAREAGDARRLALLASAYGESKLVQGIGEANPEAVAVLSEALSALGDEDSIERVAVLVGLAQQNWLGSGYELGLAYAKEAVVVARRVGHPRTLCRALLSNSRNVWVAELEESRRIAEEALAVARTEGYPDDEAEARLALLLQSFAEGDLAGCHEQQAEIERLVEGTQNAQMKYNVMLWNATWALLDGNLDEAERLSGMAFANGQRVVPDIALQMFGVQMSTLRFFQGRVEELLGIFEGAVKEHPQPAWVCALAWSQAVLGQAEAAKATLKRLEADDFAAIPRDANWPTAVGLMADVCKLANVPEWEPKFSAWMAPYADRMVPTGLAATSRGSGRRYTAHLHHVAGRLDEAVADYERAVEHNMEMGLRLYVPLCQLELAEVLEQRSGPGDAERVLPLLNEALDGAREMSQPSLVERALGAKMRAQGIDVSETQRSIYSVARSVQNRRPDFGVHASPDGTVTLMFSDMEGFTAMTERLGDRKAHAVVTAHNRIVREQVAAHEGTEVDNQGDGFLLAFPSPRQGLLAAIGIQRAFAAHNAAGAEHPIRVRIGLHTGEAIQDADKFFGRTVIMACRIADQAKANEILASGDVKDALADAGFSFSGQRSLALKGFSGTHPAFTVSWE